MSIMEISNMKKQFSIIIMAFFILTSCSSPSVGRKVANEIHPEAKELITNLFTIKASNISLADENLESHTLKRFKTYAESGIKIEFIKDEKLTDETLFKIEPIMNEEGSLVTVRYAEDAFYDHAATLNLTRFMETLFSEVYPTIFELYNTAINNDINSLHSITKTRRSVLTALETNPDYDPINLSQYNGYIQGEIVIWNRKLSEMDKKLKAFNKK